MSEEKRETGKALPSGRVNHPDLYKALADMVEERQRAGMKPPSPEELLAYREEELSSEAERDLRDRLVFDREAVRTLLDLDALPEAAAPTEEDDAAWADFKDRLRDGEAEVHAVPTQKGGSSRLPHYLVHGLLTAACLFLLFTGNFVGEDNRPDLSGNVLEIQLDDMVTRDLSATPFRFQGPEQSLYIKLPTKWRDFPSYGFEIMDARDQLVFSGTIDGPKRYLTCRLSARFFKSPGAHQIQVVGVRDGQKTDLGRFTLHVTL
ncbi:MAG: hypothetical protein QNK37_11955 [Acidobacteriota bacterium]|nr:hypothetical protein [Acidobacteriota bacterium]